MNGPPDAERRRLLRLCRQAERSAKDGRSAWKLGAYDLARRFFLRAADANVELKETMDQLLAALSKGGKD